MASSSALAHNRKYDVFLRFRLKDTRNNFVSHLYDALCRKKIKTFIDGGQKDMFSEYSEVSVEFQPEDIYGNLLPLNLCQVYECGVRLLGTEDKNEIHRFALTMQDCYRFCPLDRDELEAKFQAKRARFEGMRWD